MSRPPLDALLRDLGHRLRRGSATSPAAPPRLPTGEPELDQLLEGGLPCGRLSEISASPGAAQSCGRTSLALSLLAQVTRRQELAALVDAAGAFDPSSAGSRGVQLERVLWARPPARPEARSALRCAERLLLARGFALVLLDLVGVAAPCELSPVWRQLARAAAGSGSALVVLSAGRITGSSAEIALELLARRAHFGGSPALFTGLESEVALVRHRALTPRATRALLHRVA